MFYCGASLSRKDLFSGGAGILSGTKENLYPPPLGAILWESTVFDQFSRVLVRREASSTDDV